MLRISLIFVLLLGTLASSIESGEDGLLTINSIKKINDNYRRIKIHNDDPESTYSTRLNEFAPLSYDEYVNTYLSKTLNETKPGENMDSLPPTMQNDYNSIPDSFDWRAYGLVTRVRHQGSCGTCWSFTNVGAVETLHANKYGKLVELSEQDLNDCLVSGAYKNWGCKGGYPSNGFYYVLTKGLVAESAVPYAAKDLACRQNLNTKRYKIRGYKNIPYGDENSIKTAVYMYGPVTVAIDASEWGFAYYSHGVYVSKTCKPNYNNHAVLVVGYGKENGVDYWIIKNSWGRNWGENGYMKMARNRNNMCGIASMASYAYM